MLTKIRTITITVTLLSATPYIAHAGQGVNGVTLNGLSINGVTLNGVNWNGIGMNGVVYNAVMMNGLGLNKDVARTNTAELLKALAKQPLAPKAVKQRQELDKADVGKDHKQWLAGWQARD